ncbi:MAG: hypothetical protein MZV70_68975 [Desulfobacterales bacterium]|nr:hypothetical protein [Desulfobacterales bacterium]
MIFVTRELSWSDGRDRQRLFGPLLARDHLLDPVYGPEGGLSIAALSSAVLRAARQPWNSPASFRFLYDEGIVPRGELTRSYILTRAITHVASFFSWPC